MMAQIGSSIVAKKNPAIRVLDLVRMRSTVFAFVFSNYVTDMVSESSIWMCWHETMELLVFLLSELSWP